MLDTYIIATSAAVIVASLVILSSFLARYGKLVRDADKSTRLAKDVWDSVNTRFSLVDARIIDLMAKTEVLASRPSAPVRVSQGPHHPVVIPPEAKAGEHPTPIQAVPVASQPVIGGGTETEKRVLQLLVEGPKDSAQIREAVGRSREHTARLMKSLFERNLVSRNDKNKPYVYEITEGGRSYLAS